MHNYHKITPGGGLGLSVTGRMHREARYAGRNQCRAPERRAEDSGERSNGHFKQDNLVSRTGLICRCCRRTGDRVLPNRCDSSGRTKLGNSIGKPVRVICDDESVRARNFYRRYSGANGALLRLRLAEASA